MARKKSPATDVQPDRPKRRPPITTTERATYQRQIVEAIAVRGSTVGAICLQLGISGSDPAEWALADDAWAALYARAREEQAHRFAERVITASEGTDEFSAAVRRVIGWHEEEMQAAGLRAGLIRSVVAQLNNAAVQRDRLRADNYKWYASKVAAKLYGERLQLAGDQQDPLIVRYLTATK